MVSAIYVKQEDTITFKASGGTAVFTPKAVANAAGRVSAQHDRGAPSSPGRYMMHCETQCQATPTVGQTVDVYVAEGLSSSLIAGDVGTSDAGLSDTDVLRNLRYVGSISVENATADEKFMAVFDVEIRSRYFSVVWWNNTGATLTNDDAEHIVTMVEVPDEIQ